jgi:hypothetical protein
VILNSLKFEERRESGGESSWQTIYKNPVLTSQETHYVTATETCRLRLFREIVAVYCENRMEHRHCLSLMLRLTISLGIKHPSGVYDQIFITVRKLRVSLCGALSLTRGRVCRLQLLLVLASAVISGPSPEGLAT